MKDIGAGQLVQLLANVGIIAGIGFLAVEIHQNNELMEAEARFNRLLISRDAWDQQAIYGDLTELRVRSRNGETLTEVERERVNAVFMRVLVNLDWMYRELPDNSPERNYMTGVLGRLFSTDPTVFDLWRERSSQFEPAFVEWVENEFIRE